MNDDGCMVSSLFIALFQRENARASFAAELLFKSHLNLSQALNSSEILIFLLGFFFLTIK